MATIDKSGQMNVKASNGDILKLYPNTKIANVDGLQTALNGKVDAVSGKGLSTNDYTTTEKNKLAGIAAGATANIGTVTQVKVGSTAYNPSSGVVSLPAYPTTLPASDVSSWAKASTKPSYTYSEVGAAPSQHTHSSIESKGDYKFDATTKPNSLEYGISTGFVNSNSGYGSYGGVLNVRAFSNGGGTLQLYTPYSPTFGGTHLKARFGNYDVDGGNSWTELKDVAWTSDIPTSLPASDVYAWAKASTKPSYTYSEVGAAASSHTHNYAGSSSAGGAANSAAKLTNTSKIGDTNKPVYFKADGTPAAISYTIDKSVPSNAVFTDTTYSAATQSAAGLMSANDKSALIQLAALLGISSISISEQPYSKAYFSEEYTIYERAVAVSKTQLGIANSKTIVAAMLIGEDPRVNACTSVQIDNSNNRVVLTECRC